MKASRILIEKIKEFEGLRLRAYRDAVGKPTIGYGHTLGVEDGTAYHGTSGRGNATARPMGGRQVCEHD